MEKTVVYSFIKGIGKCYIVTIVSFFVFSSALFSQNKKKQFSFKNLTVNEGLSSNWVSCIEQDDEGYIWIGTQNGLNRFDGQNFLQFFNKPQNNNSLSANWVKVVTKDNKGNLWIGTTGGGLQKLNLKSKTFSKQFKINGANPTRIKDILFKENRLWVATDKGLLLSDENLEKFEYVSGLRNLFKILSYKEKECLFLTNKGLFLSEEGGLLKKIDDRPFSSIIELKGTSRFLVTYKENYYFYDLQTKILVPFNSNFIRETTIWGAASTFIYQNNILIPHPEGILAYNPKTTSEELIMKYNNENKGQVILTFFQDEEKNLWVGSKKGVYLIHNYLELYKNASNQWENVDTEQVREIYEERDSLWVGSKKGLYLWTTGNKKPKKIINESVLSFIKTKGNQLYIGVDTIEGIQFIHLDLNTGKKTKLSNIGDYRNAKIWKMIERDDKIWIAAQLFFGYYDKVTQKIKVIKKLGKYDLNEVICLDMLLDSKKRLWIATINGCYRVDDFINMNDIQFYDKASGLKSTIIVQVYEDPKKRIWLGTDNGLQLYNKKANTFKYWGRNEGLIDPKVMSIASHDGNELWLGTISKGLFRYNLAQNEFINIDKKFGVPSNECLMSSVYASNSSIFFGTENRLAIINPNTIFIPKKKKLNFFLSKAYIQSKGANKNTSFSNNELNVNHNYGNLILEFDQVNYFNPKETKFFYKIEGLFDEFIFNGENSTFSFTNLPQGNYKISIKAENSSFKPTEFVFNLHVLPPIYKTLEAYIIYLSVLLLGIFLLIKFQKKRLQARNKIFNLRRIDEAKSKLYAEISHEFKTPITLIKSNTKLLRSSKSLSIKDIHTLYSTERNTNQMLDLVSQMLDLSSIDAGQFKLDLNNYNIIEVLKLSIGLFESHAKNNNQTLMFQSDIDECWMQLDVINFRKIINNLLSNALKFTPEKGEVTVQLSLFSMENIQIDIIDNGEGIKQEHLQNIFNRHYRTFDLDNNLGNGIGMALCKELVELMGGTITVKSSQGKGSTFTVRLPILKGGEKKNLLLTEILEKEVIGIELGGMETSDKSYHLVILEDNIDMQNYYRRILSPKYKLTIFSNGEEALEKLHNLSYDFILSDIMMPKMDGFEFCRAIKKDWKTSHIPFIMVSGKDLTVTKQKGYKLGVDAYLSKPFIEEELKAIIESLLQKNIENSKYYKKLYQLGSGVDKNHKLIPTELEFIQKLQSLVLSPSINIKVDELASLLAMSRSQLHRKIKTLTGMSTTGYIHYVRIEKAKSLLEQGVLNITEVAIEVGYSDLNYFSKTFKKLTGCSPSSWKEFSGN